jgi:hypothetical protein
MIRPGSLAAAMVIHVLEMSNLIHVCIIEGLHIIGSAIGNLKGVKGNCKEWIYCAWVVRCSPQIKESLPNNIILLEKEDAFKHMGEYLEMGCMGHELLDMTRQGVSHCCRLVVTTK